ncbi:MAG TPA: hypothetical protein VH020_09400 [Stellaceae bacterium]|jgi:hypothetical protein|nr:hypothetical protein [Stellaceae bacterium]
MTRFSASDADRAYEEWGANCGPSALAAMLDKTLDEIRPHMGDFETKHYTNPTLMYAALNSAGARWRLVKPIDWPRYGLVRIQWHGPWTAPGVPARAAYRHTHWVGGMTVAMRGVGIFDINAIDNGNGWCSAADWERLLVPHIIANCEPGADGRWSRTHIIEIDR